MPLPQPGSQKRQSKEKKSEISQETEIKNRMSKAEAYSSPNKLHGKKSWKGSYTLKET